MIHSNSPRSPPQESSKNKLLEKEISLLFTKALVGNIPKLNIPNMKKSSKQIDFFKFIKCLEMIALRLFKEKDTNDDKFYYFLSEVNV